MGIINVLDKQTANLIAAGEVVERPSSAIKEMLENCADAGAKNIVAEIKNGGTTYIRITDDGKGMSREDVPKCIMRHATSKIRTGSDLEAISTFGFRGEALAAISSVSKIRIMTKQKQDSVGTLFDCDFGEQVHLEDAGCPDGTTIIVENIFENVPARRKFLKKNSTEATSVTNVCEKFILSRPDISLKLISDGDIKLESPGDGRLMSAIYSALGREFATNLILVDYTYADIRIHGFIIKPEFCRPNRNMQNFFVNNRFVRSRTMLAAIEEAYRAFCPAGKFPACVLFCDVDFSSVDVNVHPAKLEIKFSDERRIFDSAYFAVKNALMSGSVMSTQKVALEILDQKESMQDLPQVKKQETPKTPISFTTEATKPTTSVIPVLDKQDQPKVEKIIPEPVFIQHEPKQAQPVQNNILTVFNAPPVLKEQAQTPVPIENNTQETLNVSKFSSKPKLIGEVFDTYLIVQHDQNMYLIDKHAAHERIIYEKLRKPEHENSSQYLLEPINVTLVPKEAQAVIDNKTYFEKIGFEIEDFGMNTFLIRAIPTPIDQSDVKDVFTFLSGKLSEGNARSSGEIFDRALFTAACRAAIKAGDKHTLKDNEYIIEQIFNNDAVLYCPHGRPVIIEYSKEKLGKMFSRP